MRLGNGNTFQGSGLYKNNRSGSQSFSYWHVSERPILIYGLRCLSRQRHGAAHGLAQQRKISATTGKVSNVNCAHSICPDPCLETGFTAEGDQYRKRFQT